jgi:hypothetical protein
MPVIPAEAGTQVDIAPSTSESSNFGLRGPKAWVPAFAGMSGPG